MKKKINKEIKQKTFMDNLPRKERLFYKKRKIKDLGINFTTLLFSFFTIGILVSMIVYIFTTGSNSLSFDFLVRDYSEHSYTIKTKDDFIMDNDLRFENKENYENFSYKWGVALEDSTNAEENIIHIVYMDNASLFYNLVDFKGAKVTINKDYYINNLTLETEDGGLEVVSSKDKASKMVEVLDDSIAIFDGTLTSVGKGIKGSLLTTIVLILITILLALPLGIGAAIYLSIYAKDNKITQIIRVLIDVTSGIPSIIFGLAGAILFIPILNNVTQTSGGSLLSGALTLSIMLLPTIVKTVEESIRVIPNSLSEASLALGANKTQTVFKIIIPNAKDGILTSALLSISRIIGESAALIFSIGAIITDNLNIFSGNATLAVHIWSVLQGETPQYENACAISIIILGMVLILSLLTKLVSSKLNKFKGAK